MNDKQANELINELNDIKNLFKDFLVMYRTEAWLRLRYSKDLLPVPDSVLEEFMEREEEWVREIILGKDWSGN